MTRRAAWAAAFLGVLGVLLFLYAAHRYGWSGAIPGVVILARTTLSSVGRVLYLWVLERIPAAVASAARRADTYLTLKTFPIGAAIVAIFLLYLIRRGFDQAHLTDEHGTQIHSLRPVDLSDPRAHYEPLPRDESGSVPGASAKGFPPGPSFYRSAELPELEGPSFGLDGEGPREGGRGGPGRMEVPGDEVPPPVSESISIWTAHGRTTVPNDLPPPPLTTPPSKSKFPTQMLETFIVITVILVLSRVYWMNLYDQLVRLVASVLYYPYPPPSHIIIALGPHSIPDYILLMYLAWMLSWGFASGLFWSSKFSRAQRLGSVEILVLYLFVEALVDSVSFTLGTDKFVASGFLVVRGVVGGFFTFTLLLDSFVLPQPMRIVPRFSRHPGTISLFVALAIPSLLLAGGILAVFWNYLVGLHITLPFAVLLLFPLITLVIFNVLGRIFYERELRARPVPSVADYHPPVTIIIPAYNEEERIAQAIRSADGAARLYPGFTEVVVGNDGSTDHTSEVAREEIRKMKHATGIVVDLPHGGKSNALNGVLRLARGEVMIRIDADCRLSEEFGFGAIIPHFADPEVGAVQGMILPLQRTGWVRKMRLQEICWNHLFLRRGLMATRSTQVVDGAFSSFRRKDMLAVGGWVPWNGEDNEITLRMYRLGYRTRYEPKALAFEDVPKDYAALRKQRVRWNRGGVFAHRRHLGALTSPAFEFGGIATLIWMLTFLKSGMRYLVYVYAVLVTLLAGIPTLITIAFVVAFLLIPRGGAIVYYLVRLGYYRDILWVLTWPVTSAIKQSFAVEAFGTMTPGHAIEFSE